MNDMKQVWRYLIPVRESDDFGEDPETVLHAVEGEPLTVRCEAEGKGLVYEWDFVEPDSNEWRPANGHGIKANADVLTIAKATKEHHGLAIRCRVRGSAGDMTAVTRTYAVEVTPATTIIDGGLVSLSESELVSFVEAEDEGAPVIDLSFRPGETYQARAKRIDAERRAAFLRGYGTS